MFDDKIIFLSNYGTYMMYQNNLGGKMIISLANNMVVVTSGVEFTCARARLRSDVLSDPRAALLGQRTTF